MYQRMSHAGNYKESPKAPRAFTLVETLVAIAILTISIVGPFQIAQGVLQQSYLVRDQLIAGGLAQEGMEYVRQIRDSNYIYTNHNPAGPNPSWLYGVDGSIFNNVSSPNCYNFACVVDPSQDGLPGAVLSCLDQLCTSRPLYLSSANLYNQQLNGSKPTRFTRKVKLKNISPTETEVTVTVTWDNHGTKTVVLTENLRDWL